MGSRLSFPVSNVIICALIVSVRFSEKSLFTITKMVKKITSLSTKGCFVDKADQGSNEDVRHEKRKPRPHNFT